MCNVSVVSSVRTVCCLHTSNTSLLTNYPPPLTPPQPSLTYGGCLLDVCLSPAASLQGGPSVVLQLRHGARLLPQLLLGLGAHPAHPLHPDDGVVRQADGHVGGAGGPGQGEGGEVVRAGRGVAGAVIGRGLQLDVVETQAGAQTATG